MLGIKHNKSIKLNINKHSSVGVLYKRYLRWPWGATSLHYLFTSLPPFFFFASLQHFFYFPSTFFTPPQRFLPSFGFFYCSWLCFYFPSVPFLFPFTAFILAFLLMFSGLLLVLCISLFAFSSIRDFPLLCFWFDIRHERKNLVGQQTWQPIQMRWRKKVE